VPGHGQHSGSGGARGDLRSIRLGPGLISAFRTLSAGDTVGPNRLTVSDNSSLYTRAVAGSSPVAPTTAAPATPDLHLCAARSRVPVFGVCLWGHWWGEASVPMEDLLLLGVLAAEAGQDPRRHVCNWCSGSRWSK